VAAGSRR